MFRPPCSFPSLLLALLGVLAPSLRAANFIVTTTADAGTGSLRAAIAASNATPEADAISFASSTAGGAVNFHDATPDIIDLASQLPSITGATTITGPGADKLTMRRPSAAANFGLMKINLAATLNLSGVTLSGGVNSGFGGAISNSGSLTLTQVQVSGNSSLQSGGGLHNAGTLTVAQCALVNNTATFHGAGIYNDSGTVTLVNTTISANNALTGRGGGVRNLAAMTLTNCTVSGNSADIFNAGGGIQTEGTLTLQNTIVAGNIINFGTETEIAGAVSVSNGANFIGNPAGATGLSGTDKSFASTGTTLAQLLGALANNGGPTLTQALPPGSVAINAGNNAAAAGLTRDQRNYGPRNVSGIVDIGAYEFAATAPEVPSLVVTTRADVVDPFNHFTSLREAILLANTFNDPQTITFSATSAAGEVNFHDGTARFIDLASQLPALTRQTTITGPGLAKLTVRRSATAITNFRILQVDATGNVSISGLTISGGLTSGAGAGILNGGTLNLNSCLISGNTATGGFGGGMANQGLLTVVLTTFSGNSGLRGGGLENFGTASISRSYFLNNTAAGEGGGIDNAGSLTVLQTQLTSNTAGSLGGGIATELNSTLTIYSSSLISNSSSTQGGGGMSSDFNSTVVIANSTISENTAFAAGHGGGILNNGLLTMGNCTLAENFASGNGGGIYSLSATSGLLTLKNSIVAGNVSTLTGPSEIYGVLLSNGANFIGTPAGATGVAGSDLTFDNTQVNDVYEVVSPSSGNGGPTDTNALAENSPALNGGNKDDIPQDLFDFDNDGNTSEALPFDQRGYVRLFGTAVDIGAYEFNPTTPLQSWRALHGLASNGSQDLSNPSGDGVKNLLKYAFNLAPNAGDLTHPANTILAVTGTAGLPRITIDNTKHLVITFVRRKASSTPGVTTIPETGADLTTLTPISLTSAVVDSIDATWERVTVVDPTPGVRRYGRVRVTVTGP